MIEKLKPCPFCGNEVEVDKIPLWYGNGRGYSGCYEFKIKCKNCGCAVDQPKNDSICGNADTGKDGYKVVPQVHIPSVRDKVPAWSVEVFWGHV